MANRIPRALLQSEIDQTAEAPKKAVQTAFKSLIRLAGPEMLRIDESLGSHVGIISTDRMEEDAERLLVLQPLADGTFALVVQDGGGYSIPLGKLILVG